MADLVEVLGMPTVTEYEDLRFALICAFTDALQSCRDNYESKDDHGAEAFSLALTHGWDSAEDEDFMGWCLKATPQEILAEGLVKALANCKP